MKVDKITEAGDLWREGDHRLRGKTYVFKEPIELPACSPIFLIDEERSQIGIYDVSWEPHGICGGKLIAVAKIKEVLLK